MSSTPVPVSCKDFDPSSNDPVVPEVAIQLPPTIAEGVEALAGSFGSMLLQSIERETGVRLVHVCVNRQQYPRQAFDDTYCLTGKVIDRAVLELAPGGKQLEGNPREVVPVVLFQVQRFRIAPSGSYLFARPEEVQRECDMLELDMLDPFAHMSLNKGFDNPFAKSHPSITFWYGEDGNRYYSYFYTLPDGRRVADFDYFEGVRGNPWYAGTPKKKT